VNDDARDLIAAFQAAEQNEAAAVLLDDKDGFDAPALRVLAAWGTRSHRWTSPPRRCPDNGRATPAAYAWLVSGLEVDYHAVAEAAGVSLAVARAKVRVLLGNRLVYPDGSLARIARATLQASIAKRIRKLQPKKPDAQTN
jgi:hypothetical protein